MQGLSLFCESEKHIRSVNYSREDFVEVAPDFKFDGVLDRGFLANMQFISFLKPEELSSQSVAITLPKKVKQESCKAALHLHV